jgi:thymidylate synthase ThyX
VSIAARVVADSISPQGKRITTFVLTYPRFVHAEFMTHRVFSRNAASSRAIPARKIRASVRMDPAMPVYWGANQAGMQAEAELKGWRLALAKLLWTKAAYLMLAVSWLFEKLGLHKQIANRILEPWFNITVVCTSTEWANFYHLRNHAKAQPEIRELAISMLEAQNASIPRMLQAGEWHLPFVEDSELEELGIKLALQVSVARCARVSYLNHEGKRSSTEEDQKLFVRLVGEDPKHASPAEHQATPADDPGEPCGNFFGWIQHRKMFPNENLVEYKGLTIQ